jgi:hypothetical protein
VVLWFQSEGRYDLKHQHQQLLWRNSGHLDNVPCGAVVPKRRSLRSEAPPPPAAETVSI